MRKMWLLMALLLVGCPTPPDPTPPVVDTDLCGEAGKNLEELQCRDREGNPMWVNLGDERELFVDTCKIAQEAGGIFLNPKCISEASSCEEAKKCPMQ